MKALIYLREVEDVDGFTNIVKELLTKSGQVKASLRSEFIEVEYFRPEDFSKVVEDLDIISAEVELENVTIDRLVRIMFALNSFEAIHYDNDRTLTIFCGNKDELVSVLKMLSSL